MISAEMGVFAEYRHYQHIFLSKQSSSLLVLKSLHDSKFILAEIQTQNYFTENIFLDFK
jgi:hypothetical protein